MKVFTHIDNATGHRLLALSYIFRDKEKNAVFEDIDATFPTRITCPPRMPFVRGALDKTNLHDGTEIICIGGGGGGGSGK